MQRRRRVIAIALAVGLDTALFSLLIAFLVRWKAFSVALYVGWIVLTLLISQLIIARLKQRAVGVLVKVRRQVPTLEELHCLFTYYAAFGLMLPGPFSDLAGILFFIKPLRSIAVRRYHRQLKMRLEPHIVDSVFEEENKPALKESSGEDAGT